MANTRAGRCQGHFSGKRWNSPIGTPVLKPREEKQKGPNSGALFSIFFLSLSDWPTFWVER
jgi:hypothetical protein